VDVAVRLSKARIKGAKQSARPRGPLLLKIAPREMKHALKMHVPGLGPEQSHYYQSRRWSRLDTALSQITRITPNWIYTEYTVLKNFSPFRIFEKLALALKNRVALKIFTVLNIFFIIQDS